MAVELYPHNQTAYRKALGMLEKLGKAAVVHPTGTGKSFIAFKLAEEHPGKKICWLAPSEYIFQSQRENYLEAGGKEEALSDITFLTYAKLMYSMEKEKDNTGPWNAVRPKNAVKQRDSVKLGDAEKERDAAQEALSAIDSPDYIILDEFHRCGAESWGRSVEALLEEFPKAKVLGLSATHIRYLDSRRDMADELFDGRIASKMDLGEALSAGILPVPLYICGLYEYQSELEKISLRVSSQRNAGVRDRGAELLNELRCSLQDADGPREIFARYMKKDGKYILFCTGRAHMKEMMGKAAEWFVDLDAEPAIYHAIYDSEDSAEEVCRFQKDRSSHLKLLYCIDMLNEGIHVADVDGVVLLRPTSSPTLYLQQIGRALSVPERKSEKQPIIFDLVDNFDGLKCIDSFLEQYRCAIKGGSSEIGDDEKQDSDSHNADEENNRKQYKFRIIDEARSSRVIFEKLLKVLASSWETCFQEAEKYYAAHGDLKIPKRYITENGIALGSWLLTQKRVRAGNVPGNLTKEQILRLDGIGMEWESRAGKAWERGYQELVDFYEENGHTDVPARYVTEGGYPLGKFVSNQRTARKNALRLREAGSSGKNACAAGCTLTAERERKLDRIGFIWEKGEHDWKTYYAAAKEFYEREGHLRVSTKHVTEDGLHLGVWIQRKAHERESLSEEKVRALDAIGMVWGSRYDAKWDEKYRLAEQYYREHGNLDVPKDYEIDGVNIGRWIHALRSAKEKPESYHYRLDERRKNQLDTIGIKWSEDPWEVRYHLAEQYYREHGSLKVSQAYVAEAGGKRIWLGKWLAEQRRKHNGGQKGKHDLTEEQEKKLEEIGIEW